MSSPTATFEYFRDDLHAVHRMRWAYGEHRGGESISFWEAETHDQAKVALRMKCDEAILAALEPPRPGEGDQGE